MTAGFTPGPWTAYEFGADWYVATNEDDSGPMLRVGSIHADREANANLIAAAPELYRANERQRDLIASVQLLCTQYLEPGGLTDDEFIGRVIAQLDGPAQREIEAERDAALAKARGEA